MSLPSRPRGSNQIPSQGLLPNLVPAIEVLTYYVVGKSPTSYARGTAGMETFVEVTAEFVAFLSTGLFSVSASSALSCLMVSSALLGAFSGTWVAGGAGSDGNLNPWDNSDIQKNIFTLNYYMRFLDFLIQILPPHWTGGVLKHEIKCVGGVWRTRSSYREHKMHHMIWKAFQHFNIVKLA